MQVCAYHACLQESALESCSQLKQYILVYIGHGNSIRLVPEFLGCILELPALELW